MFAAATAAGALRARALDRSGAVAAWAIGTLTYGAGGWPATLVLLAFFLPSVALSRLGRLRKKALVDIGKGGARDAWQVLANGGAATLCLVAAAFAPNRSGVHRSFGNSGLWTAAFAGGYAAATADTWGTEIGTLARGAPRSILTGRKIAGGLSGGVTLAGTFAEVAGAVWIASATLAVFRIWAPLAGQRATATGAPAFAAIALGGIIGALVDSLLGATAQELRYCARCARSCEIDPHLCGMPTVLTRGIPGFSNDLVNAIATGTGAGSAFFIMRARRA